MPEASLMVPRIIVIIGGRLILTADVHFGKTLVHFVTMMRLITMVLIRIHKVSTSSLLKSLRIFLLTTSSRDDPLKPRDFIPLWISCDVSKSNVFLEIQMLEWNSKWSSNNEYFINQKVVLSTLREYSNSDQWALADQCTKSSLSELESSLSDNGSIVCH